MKNNTINTIANIITVIKSGLFYAANEEQLLRHAQAILFRKMEQNNTPLAGWNQFDSFIDSINEGKSFKDAYTNAMKEPASFRVEIKSGDGSKKNPWILD